MASGCSSSVVSGMSCWPEVRKSTTILTAGRKCLLSQGVRSITLIVTNRNPLKTNMLVVNSKPLGFDLLLGMDIIKKLGGMHIDKGGKAQLAHARLSGVKWTCGSIYGSCKHMHQKVERMAASRTERIRVRPSQGILSSMRAPIKLYYLSGPIKPYYLRDEGIAWPAWGLVSMWQKDKHIQRAISAYIDDAYVDESIMPVARVKEHLYSFHLLSKEPERLQDGVRVLGLQV